MLNSKVHFFNFYIHWAASRCVHHSSMKGAHLIGDGCLVAVVSKCDNSDSPCQLNPATEVEERTLSLRSYIIARA